jgi:membrane-associated phospholipid phosphatase
MNRRSRSAKIASLLVSASILCSTATGAADEPRTRDVQLTMLGSGWFDLGYVALNGAAAVAGTYLIHPRRVDVAPLDGLGHRPRVDALGRASDFAVVIGLGAGVGLSFLTEYGNGVRDGDIFRGPVVITEGALAGMVFTQLIKNVFGVCRPRDWNESTRRCETVGETAADEEMRQDEAHRSFPSGHNAPLAGMAGAALGLYLLPQPRRAEYLPVALTSLGFALTTVVLRERGGAHSWVDTGAAFVTGGLAGFLTALLHVRTTSDGSAGTAASGTPMVVGYGSSF